MTPHLLRDQISRVVQRAGMAPSIHNSQPWRFHATDTSLEVRADRLRHLPHIDATGRQLAVSVGAAVEFARLALRAEGFEVGCVIGPDPDQPDLIARLTPLRAQTVDSITRTLVRCMSQRSTYRHAFDPRPVPVHILDSIRHSVHAAGCGTMTVSANQLSSLVVLLERAERAELDDPRYREELRKWRTSDADATQGVPDSALAGDEHRISRVPLRHFDVGGADVSDTPDVDNPVLLLITTATDDPADWVAAGRGLAQLLLHATAAGLQASPVTQSLDADPHRALTGRLLGVVGHPQMLMRVGYGRVVTEVAPRRPVRETLTFAATR